MEAEGKETAEGELAAQDKESPQGTSLAVQWIRLRAPNAGGLGSIPGQETRSHVHAATKSSHATTKELASPNQRARLLQLRPGATKKKKKRISTRGRAEVQAQGAKGLDQGQETGKDSRDVKRRGGRPTVGEREGSDRHDSRILNPNSRHPKGLPCLSPSPGFLIFTPLQPPDLTLPLL